MVFSSNAYSWTAGSGGWLGSNSTCKGVIQPSLAPPVVSQTAPNWSGTGANLELLSFWGQLGTVAVADGFSLPSSRGNPLANHAGEGKQGMGLEGNRGGGDTNSRGEEGVLHASGT